MTFFVCLYISLYHSFPDTFNQTIEVLFLSNKFKYDEIKSIKRIHQSSQFQMITMDLPIRIVANNCMQIRCLLHLLKLHEPKILHNENDITPLQNSNIKLNYPCLLLIPFLNYFNYSLLNQSFTLIASQIVNTVFL
jgi:hypothetical protein